jgi:hypothetical protein
MSKKLKKICIDFEICGECRKGKGKIYEKSKNQKTKTICLSHRTKYNEYLSQKKQYAGKNI